MNTDPQISYEIVQKLRYHLQLGENIRWIGQPNAKTAALSSVVEAVIGASFLIFTIIFISRTKGFGVFIFNIGNVISYFVFVVLFFLLFERLRLPLANFRIAKKTYYIVTNFRALIFEDKETAYIQSFGLDKLEDIELLQNSDGSGNLIFIRDNAGYMVRAGFIGIPNVRSVEAFIMDIIKK